mmetsp:Transcript_30400/g.66667  ORF Transcript_30400/g.66667 Transcript_30400/m.66667 type:complete len:265 (-) Transcript_30400:118-912(-)
MQLTKLTKLMGPPHKLPRPYQLPRARGCFFSPRTCLSRRSQTRSPPFLSRSGPTSSPSSSRSSASRRADSRARSRQRSADTSSTRGRRGGGIRGGGATSTRRADSALTKLVAWAHPKLTIRALTKLALCALTKPALCALMKLTLCALTKPALLIPIRLELRSRPRRSCRCSSSCMRAAATRALHATCSFYRSSQGSRRCRAWPDGRRATTGAEQAVVDFTGFEPTGVLAHWRGAHSWHRESEKLCERNWQCGSGFYVLQAAQAS